MGRYHPRRLLFAALLLLLLYLHIRHSRNDEFYSKTVQALDKKSRDKAWKDQTDAKVQQILNHKISPQVVTSPSIPQPAASTLSDAAPRLPPNPPSAPIQSQDDDDKGITGQKKVPAEKPKYIKESSNSSSPPLSSKPTSSPEPTHLAQVRAALDDIIHHHSIVIFSKTYCPHSRRAKSLLMESYDIIPKPYVVELDTLTEPLEGNNDDESKGGTATEAEGGRVVTMGRALQDLLAERTGRRTVPNIMVLGMSIGGADEVVKLHEEDALASKVKGMVGKRLERCERRPQESGDAARPVRHGAL